MEAVGGSGMEREGSPEKVVIKALIIVAVWIDLDCTMKRCCDV